MAKTQIAPNLFILEKANGKKYYVARLTVNGKQVDRGLGNADKISLREAKYELARLIANPNPEPKKKTESTGMTFAEAVPLAMADIANVKRYKNDRSVNQWLQSLNDYAIPHLGHIDVEDITREDVLNTLKPIWFKIPETAKRTRARIESVLAWAIRRGHRKPRTARRGRTTWTSISQQKKRSLLSSTTKRRHTKRSKRLFDTASSIPRLLVEPSSLT